MKEMQSAYSTYEKVHDMMAELEYFFDDAYDTLTEVTTSYDYDDIMYHLNRLKNWTVIADVKLEDLAGVIEDLKIVRNKFDDLLNAAITKLKTDRTKLEVFKHVVSDLN